MSKVAILQWHYASLQTFLSSVRGADAVFLALVDRARAEPLRCDTKSSEVPCLDLPVSAVLSGSDSLQVCGAARLSC